MATPEGWVTGQLRDDVELVSGQHLLADDWHERPTGVPYLTGPADFPDGRISFTKFTDRPKVMCRRGDVVVTVKGAGCGRLARAPSDACISRQLMAVRARRWDQAFVFHTLAQAADRLMRDASGLIPGLSREQLLGLELTVPPLGEQRNIAAILSSIDDTIEKTEAVIAQLEVVKKAMMQELLTRGMPGRHTRFKQTEVGEIPEGWDVIDLQSLCSRVVDCLHSTPQYVDDSPYLAIRTADVVPGRVLLRQARRVSEESFRERTGRLLPIENDILYSREGERFGIAACVPSGVSLCLAQRMMHLRAADDADPRFLMWLMNSALVYEQAVAEVGGSTSPHVNIGSIRKFRVPRPPRDEQVGIREALDASEAYGAALEGQLLSCRSAKSAIAARLLSGDLRVTPAETAP